MANVEAVRKLKVALLDEQSAPRILDILLNRLSIIKVDFTVLRETLIGATVANLKKHSNEEVANAAKKLVKKWKVHEQKENLRKEESPPKILAILKRLENVNMDLTILEETLIGRRVAKLEKHSNEDVANAAKNTWNSGESPH